MLARRWLDDVIRQHDERIARRGREYIGRVRRLRFERRSGVVTCTVAGSGNEPYVVTLQLPTDALGEEPEAPEALAARKQPSVRRGAGFSARRGESSEFAPNSTAATDVLDASCTCPYGEAGRFLCKHTFAAATRLAELWDARPEADLAALLAGEDGTPGWSARPLQLLDVFLHDSADGAEASEPTGRLCWIIKPYRGGPFGAGLSVRAVAETWLGGRWRRSEPLLWDRLIDAFDSPDLVATSQDREAILAVRRDEQSYGFHSGKKLWTVDAFALIAALVGHPRVFLAGRESQKLVVTSGALGLAAVVRDDGYGIVPAIDGGAAEVTGTLSPGNGTDAAQAAFFPGLAGVIALDRKAGRLTVAEANPKVRRLVAALRPEETVPFLEIEEFVSRLVRTESLLPVVWPEELIGDRASADGRIRVRLEQLNPFGLSVRLLSQPSEGSSSYEPGCGPEVAVTCERGRRIERVRDLEGERLAAENLACRLRLSGLPRPKPWRWVIEEADAALSVVERLAHLDPLRAVAEWPAGEPIRIVGTITAASVHVRVGESRDWFDLEGDATIEGRGVPFVELVTAAAEGRSFIQLDETSWAKLADDLRDRLSRLAAILPPGIESDPAFCVAPAKLRFPRAFVPVADECLRGISGADLSRSPVWSAVVKVTEDRGEIALPSDFGGTLRPYQVDGYRWLARRSDADLGCCLADEMGLGKTIQTLAVLARRAYRGPALVTTPTSVEPNWLDEAQRFIPSLRVHRLREMTSKSLSSVRGGDLVLASHALLRLRSDDLTTVRWPTLVVDEAHAVKNRETRLAEAVRRLRSDWMLALTGTPVENHPGELWAIFHLLAPDLLGPWTRFRKRFAEPVAAGDRGAAEALRWLVGPYLLRRTKEGVLPDLPPLIELTRFVDPSEEQRALYDRFRQAALADLEASGPNGRRVFAALTRLRQVAAHPALLELCGADASPKLDAILNVVDELRAEGRRPLVFSPFAKHLRLIAAAAEGRGLRPLLLTGSTPGSERAGIVAAFQQGEGDLFLISLKAGGTGLNLTAADAVLITDPWWNPAAESQAAARAHRIGQGRPVTVVRFVVSGTIEEKMLDLQETKRNLTESLLGAPDSPAADAVKELLS